MHNKMEDILIGGLVKCYLEASEMSGESKFLIPSNFSNITHNQLRKHNIACTITNVSEYKFIVKYWYEKVEGELLFDVKSELRNRKIDSIL